MANQANSLSHTKWWAAYRTVSAPKYRRKITCNQYRDSLGEIFRQLRSCKGVEIIEGHLMPDHVHMLAGMPPKPAPASFMGHLKYKFGNRRFRSEGCCVSTVGLNEAAIRKYIQEQEAHDIAPGRLSVKEHGDPSEKQGRGRPFRGGRQCASRFQRHATSQGRCALSKARGSALRRCPRPLAL